MCTIGDFYLRGSLLFDNSSSFYPTGHTRSFSHGGVTFSRTNSGREKNPSGGGGAAVGASNLYQPVAAPPYGELLPRPPVLLPSALKKPGHRRVFSHGQIGSPEQMAGGVGMGGAHVRGHARSGSKTDFILPPGHEIRERKRWLRSNSYVISSVSDPCSLNPDPDSAKKLNPDPDPSCFLTLPGINRYKIIL